MKIINEARHVLAVKDLDASKNYYRNVLGLSVINEYPGWIFLARESFFVMLGECKDARPAKNIGDHSYFAYLVVTDAKSLYNEFESNGAEFIKKLKDEEWGMREFGIVTTDGHRLMFGESISD